MRRPAALLPTALACLCRAVRLQHDGRGQPPATAPSSVTREVLEQQKPRPRERHLQYVYVNRGGGIHDRLWTFTWLLKLGRYHNATTHIRGGNGGSQLYLHPKHSRRISPTWDAYFDVEANGGNPFHEVVDFAGCRTLSDPSTDLSKIFDGGAMCVNLTISMFALQRKTPPGMPAATIPPSKHVRRAAARFRARARLPTAYGALHVRRCDLLNEGRHQECTAVDSICKIIKRHSNYTAWFVSLYAEPGYRERLTRRLNLLGGRYVFEDEAELNPTFPHDNYFTLMVANEIKGGASLILDSHHCPEPEIRAIRGHADGQYLQRFEDDELAEVGEASRLRELASEEDSEIARFGGWEGSASAYGATCNPGG